MHTTRATGAKKCFLLLRQQQFTVQALLAQDEKMVSKQMVKFAASVTVDSIIEVEASVVAPPERIQSATVHDAELFITSFFVVSSAAVLPFKLDDALRPPPTDEEAAAQTENSEKSQDINVSLPVRLDNRIVDLRVRIALILLGPI